MIGGQDGLADETGRGPHHRDIRPTSDDARSGSSIVPQRNGGLVLDALASRWTATIMRPGLVEEVEVGIPHQSVKWQADSNVVQAAAFRQGYQDFNGRLEWEDRFIDVILNCENKTYGWVWNPSASSFITVAQFHEDSWARASAATGLDDPYNLYHVGAAVAYWSNSIEHPGSSGGWAECWWEGIVP